MSIIEEETEELNNNNSNKSIKDKKKNLILYCTITALGLINNTGYNIVITSSSRLAESFNKDNYMTLFQTCLVLFSCFIRVINSRYLIKIVHSKRCIYSFILIIIGLFIVSISNYFGNFGFYTALFGSIILGLGTSLGDSTNIGFLKAFDSEFIGAYSSGTGFSGIFGAGLTYVLVELLNLNTFKLAWISIIFYIPYYFLFMYMIKIKKDSTNQEQIIKEASINLEFSFKNMKKILKKSIYYISNLGLVYFLEYSVLGLCGFRNVLPSQRSNYSLLYLFYRIGVFITRSSLKFFKINKITLVTLIQYLWFLNWILVAFLAYVGITWQLIFTLIVGVVGGLSYVNIFYLVMESKDILKSEKELAFFSLAISSDFGIMLSTAFNILFAYLYN